LVKEGRRRNES